jgi:hypothetical protein
VAASRSTRGSSSVPRKLLRDLRGLGPDERIAVIGCAVMIGSLLLPWYQSPISNDLVLTGIGGFSWAEGALLLIAAATFLALEGGGGVRRVLARVGPVRGGGGGLQGSSSSGCSTGRRSLEAEIAP